MGHDSCKSSLQVSAVILLLLFSSFCMEQTSTKVPVQNQLSEEYSKSPVTIVENNWNQSGVSVSGLEVEDDGNVLIERPSITWQTSPGSGLPLMKTGAATVAIPELGEIWIIGGRDDVNPMASSDEIISNMVGAYNIDTHVLREVPPLPMDTAYAGAVLIGGDIYVIGDWWPGSSNPSISSRGKVQIFNISTDTWSNGTSMPSGKEVGHAGVCEYGGYIWVAGGVKGSGGTDETNRTLRYDPVADNWTEVAKMNNSKFGLALVPYEDKIYAFGGGERTSTWGAPLASKIVEVYDPAIDNWTQLNTTIPKAVSGVNGVVRHNEIMLVGGINSNQVTAWSPSTDTWRTLTSLPTQTGDMGVSLLNGTLFAIGGDYSQYPYSNWGQSYSADIFYVANTSVAEGFLTSDVLDLRPNTQSSAQPRNFSLSASQPNGTSALIQYRYGIDAISTTAKTWAGPDGTIFSWFTVGDYPLTISGKANFFQYRIKMNTTAMSTWELPTLNNITIKAAHTGFIGTIPPMANARGQPVLLMSEHADAVGSSAWLKLQPVTATGIISGSPSILIVNETGDLSIDDPQGLLFASNSTINQTASYSRVNWSLTFSDVSPTNKIIFTTGNLAIGQDMADALSHLHFTPLQINEDVTASIGTAEILPNHSPISANGVVPALSQISIAPNISFSDGTDIDVSIIEWRLQATTILTNGTGWYNWSTEWTSNSSETLSIPENISGKCKLQMQVRTALSIDLSWDGIPLNFTIDGDRAIMLSSQPVNNTYIDVQSQRSLTIVIGDSGGPDPQNTQLKVWIEGHHDSNVTPDGMAQENEFVIVNHSVEGSHGLWWVNATFNESGNPDHGGVEVILSGFDNAGHEIGINGSGIHIAWLTRDARLSEILEVRPLTLSLPGLGQRMEPLITIGWELDITDFNSVDDIQEMQLLLGGDPSIGVRWDGITEVCQVLGGVVDVDSISCSSSEENNIETVVIKFAINWDFDPEGLERGLLSAKTVDKDGTNESWSQNNSWFFSDQVNSTSLSLEDISGEVTGDLSQGYFLAAGDSISWKCYLEFLESGAPLNGPLTLSWDGVIKGVEWKGSTLVQAVDGYIESVMSLPESGGELSGSLFLSDSSGDDELFSIELPVVIIDDTAPVLQESQKYVMESRFALDDVVIVANVMEATSWTQNLTIDCQVRSYKMDWPVFSSSATPDSTFGELVLFQFNLDLQHLGDASLLPPEATFACWVSGNDDAGNILDNGGLNNHATEPWLEMILPANGPDLAITAEWKSDVENAEPDIEYLVGLTVTNLDEEIDKPIIVTVWLEHGTTSTQIFQNSKNEGLKGGYSWTMTFGMTPNAGGEWRLVTVIDANNTIAELNETNNNATISLTASPLSEGLAGQVFTTTNILAIIAIIALIIGGNVILTKRRNKNAGGSRKGPPAKRGPPPASSAKIPPSGIGTTTGPNIAGPNAIGHSQQQDEAESQPLDLAAAGLALAAFAPSVEETQAVLGGEESYIPPSASSPSNEVSQVVSQVSPSAEVSEQKVTWDKLPAGGEYQYRDDGTWYTGESCGQWKQNDAGDFVKIV